MTVELDDAGISDDIASYLNRALEEDLWNGRLVSKMEMSPLPDNPVFEHLAAQFAWVETPEANQSLLSREIQEDAKENSWLKNFLDGIAKGIVDSFNPSRPNQEISSIFSTQGTRVPWMSILGSNGMNTTMGEAIAHAEHLAQFAKGFCVDWIYNNTNGLIVDMLEILTLNLRGFSPKTAALHRQAWDRFHEENIKRPHAKCLQFGHSQDSIHIFNALKKAPKEIQNRVIVMLFGPAVVIPKGLCFRVRHYACEGDLVPLGEVLYAGIWGGLLKGLPVAINHEDIIWLPPHPDTKSPHDFQNPTFNSVKKLYIDDYIERNGEYLDFEGDINDTNFIKLEDLC